MTNTNVTVDSDFKLKVVHLVNDKNLCQIHRVEIKIGAKTILEQDEVRIDNELYQLKAPEEEMRYQITLFGDDGENATFNYVHKTDGNCQYKILEVLNDCGHNFAAGLHFSFIILIIVAFIATIVIISVVICILYKKKQRENKSILRHEQEQDNLDGKMRFKNKCNIIWKTYENILLYRQCHCRIRSGTSARATFDNFKGTSKEAQPRSKSSRIRELHR